MSEIGQKLIETVREVAKERPFHIHQGICVYVSKGEPGCLVGQALWRLGLIDANFEHTTVNDEGIEDALDYLGITMDDDERVWLCLAQGFQDERRTWLAAVRDADDETND